MHHAHLDSFEKIIMTRRLIFTPLLICFMVVRHIDGDDQSHEVQHFLLMCVQILPPCALHPRICSPNMRTEVHGKLHLRADDKYELHA